MLYMYMLHFYLQHYKSNTIKPKMVMHLCNINIRLQTMSYDMKVFSYTFVELHPFEKTQIPQYSHTMWIETNPVYTQHWVKLSSIYETKCYTTLKHKPVKDMNFAVFFV